MSRSERRATTVEGRRAETAARLDRRLREAIRHRDAPTPALDEARAEFGSARPSLVVETLQQRLERLVPGAVLMRATQQRVVAQWAVWRASAVVTGSSEREAVDKAVALWGAR